MLMCSLHGIVHLCLGKSMHSSTTKQVTQDYHVLAMFLSHFIIAVWLYCQFTFAQLDELCAKIGWHKHL